MFPFFFLKIRNEGNHVIFNPVDNREYVLNSAESKILEQCDGTHTLDEIAGTMELDLGKTTRDSVVHIAAFLDRMYRAGIVAWRNEKIDYEKDWAPPSMVYWDITSECNLRCIHCYNFSGLPHENELSAEEIKRKLEEMSVIGVENITFSGGEPLIRKDFFEIANHAISLKFKSVGIATNATLIDREIARKLKLSDLDVQVSIDGDVAVIHDTMRGMKGAFDRATRGIELLQEEGNEVSVCTTATKLNVDRIPNIIQLMQNLNIKYYRVQGLMPMGRGRINRERLGLSPQRMKELVKYLVSRNIEVSSYKLTLKSPSTDPIDYSQSGACSAAISSCSITPDGNVVPCTHFWGMNGENLRDHTFEWIWKNSTLLNYFRSILLDDIRGDCRDCKWLSLCHGGCKAENYANGDIFSSNVNCWVADEMRNNF